MDAENTRVNRHTLFNKIEAPMAEEKSNEVARTSAPWSDLPSDLFGLIVCHLNLVDRFHLALACESFLAIVRAAPRHNVLLLGSPCLFLLANGNKSSSLINPLHKEKYTINTTSLPSKVSILSSKDGWLLILSRDKRSIFFFNPLSKATIRLPDIDFHCACAFSFSCSPTSPDCVVIAIHPYIATINFCRRGDKSWTKRDNDMDTFSVTYTNPVFHQGSFYCFSDEGSLGVFDPIAETWIVMQIPNVKRFNSHRIHVVESNGELLRVCVKPKGEQVYVCKLDPTCKRWEEIDGLKERQLYVGRISSCSEVISGKGGRIYFPLLMAGDDVIISYSCDTGEVYPRGNFYGGKEFPLACWIEPRWLEPSVEELQWNTQ